jgi:hypothetical protein
VYASDPEHAFQLYASIHPCDPEHASCVYASDPEHAFQLYASIHLCDPEHSSCVYASDPEHVFQLYASIHPCDPEHAFQLYVSIHLCDPEHASFVCMFFQLDILPLCYILYHVVAIPRAGKRSKATRPARVWMGRVFKLRSIHEHGPVPLGVPSWVYVGHCAVLADLSFASGGAVAAVFKVQLYPIQPSERDGFIVLIGWSGGQGVVSDSGGIAVVGVQPWGPETHVRMGR